MITEDLYIYFLAKLFRKSKTNRLYVYIDLMFVYNILS